MVKKRQILLLEVLIAFAIIVLCIFPLIYPHAAMARAQRQFIKKIELDQAVSHLFAQVYQDLLTNKIEWRDIESKRQFEVSSKDLEKFNNNKSMPYKGSYHFEEVIHKPKSDTPPETIAYIYNLVFDFDPLNETKKIKGGNEKNPLEYKYKIFILRDLRSVKEPVKEEQQDNEKKESP